MNKNIIKRSLLRKVAKDDERARDALKRGGNIAATVLGAGAGGLGGGLAGRVISDEILARKLSPENISLKFEGYKNPAELFRNDLSGKKYNSAVRLLHPYDESLDDVAKRIKNRYDSMVRHKLQVARQRGAVLGDAATGLSGILGALGVGSLAYVMTKPKAKKTIADFLDK